MRPSVKSLTHMGLGCVILAICSWCAIPMGVPVTLQLFGVYLLIGILGTQKALGSLVCYLALGCLGVPVFAGFSGGIGVLTGPTGGYLLGLVPLVLFCGWLYPKAKSFWVKALVFFVGLIFNYALGTFWYGAVFARGNISPGSALLVCVVPFLLPDLCKILGSIWLLKGWEKRHGKLV